MCEVTGKHNLGLSNQNTENSCKVLKVMSEPTDDWCAVSQVDKISVLR